MEIDLVREPVVPIQDGDCIEQVYSTILFECSVSPYHLRQGTVDNAVVHLFFASEQSIPAKCPELFHVVSTIPKSHLRFHLQIKSECTNSPAVVADWATIVLRNCTEWMSLLSDERWEPLRDIVASPLFQRSMFLGFCWDIY